METGFLDVVPIMTCFVPRIPIKSFFKKSSDLYITDGLKMPQFVNFEMPKFFESWKYYFPLA